MNLKERIAELQKAVKGVKEMKIYLSTDFGDQALEIIQKQQEIIDLQKDAMEEVYVVLSPLDKGTQPYVKLLKRTLEKTNQMIESSSD